MEDKQVNIAIKKIKDVEFYVNEQAVLPENGLLNIGFNITTNFNLPETLVDITLQVLFTNPVNNEEVMKIKTNNIFLVLELADFHDPVKGQFEFPDNLMVTLLSLTVSHTRALLAKNAMGTKFSEYYLPIVNPVDLYKQLFHPSAQK